jgi:hypothetical protein
VLLLRGVYYGLVTAPKVDVFTLDVVTDVTAMPANKVPVRERVTLDPGMSVQVLPLLEV